LVVAEHKPPAAVAEVDTVDHRSMVPAAGAFQHKDFVLDKRLALDKHLVQDKAVALKSIFM